MQGLYSRSGLFAYRISLISFCGYYFFTAYFCAATIQEWHLFEDILYPVSDTVSCQSSSHHKLTSLHNLNETFHILLSPLKISPPPVLNEVIASLSKVHPPIYTMEYMWSCQTRSTEGALKSSTVQEEGLTNKGRQHLLLLHKPAPDNKGIAD